MLIPETCYVGPIKPFASGIRACTHLARVNLPNLSTAVIKAFPQGSDRAFFNEVAGGLLASHANLGSPPVGLLWVNTSILSVMFPGVVFPEVGGKALCVLLAPITTEYGLVSLGAYDTYGDSQALRDHIMAWGGLALCTAFDQWVGNIDRHANNLLVATGSKLVPIDHSDCFLGPCWHANDHECPNFWSTIRFNEIVPMDDWRLPTRAAAVHQAAKLTDAYERASNDLERLRGWLPAADGLNWLTWLHARAGLTKDLLKQRFGMLS